MHKAITWADMLTSINVTSWCHLALFHSKLKIHLYELYQDFFQRIYVSLELTDDEPIWIEVMTFWLIIPRSNWAIFHQWNNLCIVMLMNMLSRGVMIQVPHDTMCISIQRSQYNTYPNMSLNTVRCQKDVMSSMKAETPVIRSAAHNLLLQWMGYLLLQLPLIELNSAFLYIRVLPSIWSEKRICFD